MSGITDPSRIFQSVLTFEDEAMLRKLVDELSRRVADAMQKKAFESAADALSELAQLEVIGNAFVTRLIYEASQKTERHLTSLGQDAMSLLLLNQFDQVEGLVQELQDIEEFFTGDIERIASDISARMSSALTSKRDEQRIMADLQATLKSSEDARKALEMQQSFLAEQQEAQRRQIERLEQERRTAEAKAQEDKRCAGANVRGAAAAAGGADQERESGGEGQAAGGDGQAAARPRREAPGRCATGKERGRGRGGPKTKSMQGVNVDEMDWYHLSSLKWHRNRQ